MKFLQNILTNKKQGSQEFFFTDKKKKVDAPLHEDILDNKKAESLSKIAAIKAGREAGLTAEQLKTYF